MHSGRWWERLSAAGHRIHYEIFERDLHTAPPLVIAAALPPRIGVQVWRGIWSHGLPMRAAALTYITLVSLVPTLAVGFAMFKAFGGLDQAKAVLLPRLLEYIAVGSQAMVQSGIEEVLTNLHGGALGGVATIVLLASVVFLLSGMEDAFNHIWEVTRPRSWMWRIAIFWTLVTVTPTLLALGLTLPATVARLAPIAFDPAELGALGVLVSLVLPLVLIWLGFALLYFFAPNARVSPNAAAVGAVIGGTLWWAAFHAYADFSGMAVAYSKVYGSLGTVFVFLFWLFLTWVIVLGGAEVAAAVQYVPWTPTAEPREVSQATRELLALRVMAAVARRFRDGGPPPTVEDLRAEVHAPGLLTTDAVHQLVATDLLAEVGFSGRLVPLRDPARTSPADVLHALRHRGVEAIWDAEDPTTQALERWQRDADDAAAAVTGPISVLDLAAART
jgi:membrane protein